MASTKSEYTTTMAENFLKMFALKAGWAPSKEGEDMAQRRGFMIREAHDLATAWISDLDKRGLKPWEVL